MAVNQMLPCSSATSPCGPELGVLSGYSLNLPVLGSRRPSLLAACSVVHRAPSGATAGSCGRALAVGTSNSPMGDFNGATAANAVTVISDNRAVRQDVIFPSCVRDAIWSRDGRPTRCTRQTTSGLDNPNH